MDVKVVPKTKAYYDNFDSIFRKEEDQETSSVMQEIHELVQENRKIIAHMKEGEPI